MKNFFCAIFTLSLIIAEIGSDIPGCDYFDTVDLTNSTQFRNGSFQYEGIIIPKEKTAIFNYKIFLDGKKEVVPYIRGCVCHIKPCLIFCCNPPKSLEYQPLNITLLNGQVVQKDLRKDYVVQVAYKRQCESFNKIDTENRWNLFENDVLYVHGDNESFSKRQYCFFPFKDDNNNADYKLAAKLLPLSKSVDMNKFSPAQALRAISIFCLVLIIAIFLYVKKYHTMYNRCCLCYFACLSISFFLAFLESALKVPTYESCLALAYVHYFFVMATFLWLIMINLTLWKNFKELGIKEGPRFMKYNIIVWSIAVILLTFYVVADRYLPTEVPEYLKPEVGIYNCLVKSTDSAILIYFHSLILVAILINIGSFVATVRIIYVENKYNERSLTTSESTKNVKNQANFVQFLQLFAITGGLWFMEIVSSEFVIEVEMVATYIDLIPSAQGMLLFFIIIPQKSVIKSIYERIGANKPYNLSHVSSTDTDS